MSVRNCAELGENLHKIVKRLMANDNLVNLLFYSESDPLSQPILSDQEKKEEIFQELIKITPDLPAREDDKSFIVIAITSGKRILSNTEFQRIVMDIDVFIPTNTWIIKDTNLRPFAIMGEIEKSLKGKSINGLGKIEGGDFDLSFLTKEMSSYKMTFGITQYD